MLTESARGSGRRVLVVDDHPDSADASCMLLSALGYECRPAVTGENALAEVERFHPDVVICDIGLPDISGYDIARTLRSRHGSSLYLAALTGWDQPSARARALAAGFDEHLIKPANARALRAVMAASQQRRVLLALGTGEYPTVR
jgi:DNA-binding response OmpR family regulator